MLDKHVTLVGAGPVGSLLAVFLARRGFDVEIYERRPDMRREDAGGGRSINLAVSTRGLHALGQIGMEREVLEVAVPMRGRMIHPVRGDLAYQPYGKDDTQYINSISRGGLNAALMTAAEATGRVKIHFRAKVTGIDFERSELLVDEGRVSAPVVIATDGSGSPIRHAMGNVASETELDYGYKELHIPPGTAGGFQIEKNALHIWPRGTFMLIALPNLDGSFTCTLFLPWKGELSFERLREPAAVTKFFGEYFPDAQRLIPNVAEEFFSNPTGHMVTVKSSRWHFDGRALLLGDAAHAIVPFFGQGMNAGFEDCTILDDMLAARPADWGTVFSELASRRKPDCDAIADLALENFIEMRDKVADARFLLEREVEKILQNRFPGEYISRYALVTFSRVPYRLAREAGIVENRILGELCRDLTRAADVDLARAKQLIDEELAPILKGRVR